MIDVSPNHLETITRVLATYVPECEVRAFGSRATWTAKDYSDLDLAVVCEKAIEPDVLRQLREAFEASDLPFRVDVLDWHTISASFQKVIEKKYEVVQTGAKKSLGMTGEWVTSSIQEVSEKVAMGPFGSSIKVETFVPEGVPVISGQHLHGTRLDDLDYNFISLEHADKLTNANVRRGDVVFTHAGNIGQVAYIPDSSKYPRYIISQRQFYLRPNPKKVLPEFIAYFFTSAEGQHKLLANASSSGVPSIAQPVSYLRTIEIPVPPLSEQRAIAHILGTLDDKIELNRRMNETLEAMARALFKSWFVDFDPVRAKSEGRGTGLPLALADLFPNSLEEARLGEIPKEWGVGSILEVAQLLSGGTPKTERQEYWGGDVHWASAKDVSQCADAFLVATERTITQRGLTESATQMIPRYSSAVVARGATTGRMALLGEAMAMNQTCYALVTTTSTPFTLYCQLRQEIDNLVHGAHGSVFDTITTTTFATSEVLLPPKAVLLAFEESVQPLFQRILAGTKESRTLAAVRDTLLPKLISGELRIRDAERFVEATM